MRVLIAFCYTLVAVAVAAESCDSLTYGHLGLAGPCIIEKFAIYADGGSYGGVIRDSEGGTLEIAWGPPPDEQHLWTHEMCSMVMYVDAQHFTHEGGRPLSVGSEAEGELLDALQSWVDTQLEPSQQDSVLYMLSRRWVIDGHYVGRWVPERYREFLDARTPEQRRAITVLSVINYQQKQREIDAGSEEQDGQSPRDLSPPN